MTTLSVGSMLLYAGSFAPETAAVSPDFGMSVFPGLVLAVVLGIERVVGGLVDGAVADTAD